MKSETNNALKNYDEIYIVMSESYNDLSYSSQVQLFGICFVEKCWTTDVNLLNQ